MSCQPNVSYLEPTGKGFTAGGFSFEGCRQTSRRLRGLLTETRHLDAPSHPGCPLLPPNTPPPPGVGYQLGVFGGVCAGIVSVNSPTIHPPHNASCSPNSGKHIPLAIAGYHHTTIPKGLGHRGCNNRENSKSIYEILLLFLLLFQNQNTSKTGPRLVTFKNNSF